MSRSCFLTRVTQHKAIQGCVWEGSGSKHTVMKGRHLVLEKRLLFKGLSDDILHHTVFTCNLDSQAGYFHDHKSEHKVF